MPSERAINAWDKVKSKRLSQLSRHLFCALKAKGEKPLGPRACLVDAWGFLVRPRSKAGYTLDTLRKDVIACNKFVYAQLPKTCGKVDLDSVIIFSHSCGMEWNRLPENKLAVLCHALSNLGPGLRGVAEQLGMQLGSVKEGRLQLDLTQPGQGSYNEQLKKQVMATIETNKLPSNEMPAYSTLEKIDGALATAVWRYKYDERAQLSVQGQRNQEDLGRAVGESQLTGAGLMAKELGWAVAVPARGYVPHGYWQVLCCY